MSKSLKNFLKQLDLLDAVFLKENGKVYDGFISEVQKKINIIEPDAYYIFNKQPLILFFDLTVEKNKNREKEIHKQVWSFDNSPIIFVIKGDEIRVYNALNYSKKEESLEEIELTEEERNSKFSFWELQSGFTWKWLQNEYFENRSKRKQRKRVNERLFQNIKEVREYLTNINSESPLSENEANSLILRLIFIRYLIDRKVKIDETFISGQLNDVNERRKSFVNLIKQPSRLNLLFKKLNDKFNGVLFRKLDIALTQKQSNYLAGVFKGELQDEENLFKGFFFEIFDFSIIPVEVISGIYESLIDEETRKLDSAVYTPPFLVEYVLNDTVDKYLEEENTSECKIFEVAVGSGIFLVQSLRKMIDKELSLNPNQTGEEFSNRTREIAKNNLFGVDINEEALKVACFSIYIALLDYQDPKDIDVYKFPGLLNENLFIDNFFDTEAPFNQVVINKKPIFFLGNPPWKNGKKDVTHLEYLKKNNLSKYVSDFQIAQSFILRTRDFSEHKPICSLIITSKAIFNNNASRFTDKFLEDFYLFNCLDLSAVRRLVFEKADNPAMILNFKYANGEKISENTVTHASLKYNLYFKNFKALVFEKFDIKKISQKLFKKNHWLFKTALYGSTLDYKLISNFSNSHTIEKFLNQNNIKTGNGIKRGTPKRSFDNLINLPIKESKEIHRYYTSVDSKTKRLTGDDVYLEAGRDINLFLGKKITYKKRTKDETFVNISLIDENCVFKDSVNAISFSDDKKDLLFLIYAIMNSDLFTYFQFLTCSSWGVYYPEIHKKEYLSFPFLEPKKEVMESLAVLVDDFLAPLKEYYKEEFRSESVPVNNFTLSKINELINNLYNISGYEKDLIDYVLNVSRYQFQESKQHLISDFTFTDKKHYRNRDFVLHEYASIYIKEFQEIYTNEYMQIEVYVLDHFIALNFVLSAGKSKKAIVYPKDKKSEKEVLKRLASNLSISQITNTEDPTKNLFIQKDIKGFENNSFYIIKPNEYKCWHKAMAHYDVAEFKEAIQEAEIDELNMNV